MKAWVIPELNAPARIEHHPEPTPREGEVLVRVRAVALNFADTLMVKGRYQDQPGFPYIPCMEFAGEIAAGPDKGQRVAGFLTHGALAETIAVPKARLVPVPDLMPLTEAAAFQVAYGTSHLALEHRARLRPGETLLVLGAAGGVGLTAVQIGKLMDARVIAVARGADKLAVARAAGADEVIDAAEPDLRARLKALGGVDVTYDAVGGPGFLDALSASRPEGRLLAIGFASGEVPQIPANHLLVKNLSVIGLYWGGYLKFAPDVLTASLTTLLGWYEAGRLRPHVSHVLPFDRFPEALALLADRKSTGKVVLQLGEA